MNFLEQATYFGYPVLKTHTVTQDGYILELNRIPGRQNETLEHALNVTRSGERKPVLFVHGLLGSSQQWIENGPGKAWGLTSVDTGLYDAWFINLRGNRYSREHESLEPDADTSFWKFSFEEFGEHDISAAIKAIHEDGD